MQLKCEQCGKEYYQRTGRRSKYCPEHRANNFTRAAETQSRRSIDVIAADMLGRCVPPPPKHADPARKIRATDAMRFAVGLQMGLPSDRETADSVGLDWLDDDQVATVARTAREQHQAIIERKSAATSELFHRFISLSLLKLIDDYATMNPSQLALAVRAAVQALALYQGGTQAAYANLVVTWPGKQGYEAAIAAVN